MNKSKSDARIASDLVNAARSAADQVDALACELAGNIPTWRPYLWKRLDSGLLVTGCATEKYQVGRRAGERKFIKSRDRKTVAISAIDLAKIYTAPTATTPES